MLDKPYHPVSCDYHSELELLALRKTRCPIRFFNERNEEVEREDSIADLYSRNGEEFILLSGGGEIRLDCLISVDGLELSKYC